MCTCDWGGLTWVVALQVGHRCLQVGQAAQRAEGQGAGGCCSTTGSASSTSHCDGQGVGYGHHGSGRADLDGGGYPSDGGCGKGRCWRGWTWGGWGGGDCSSSCCRVCYYVCGARRRGCSCSRSGGRCGGGCREPSGAEALPAGARPLSGALRRRRHSLSVVCCT